MGQCGDDKIERHAYAKPGRYYRPDSEEHFRLPRI